MVKATQAELNKHGFDAKLVDMKGHDHNYYAGVERPESKDLGFFRTNKLDGEANWQVYQRK